MTEYSNPFEQPDGVYLVLTNHEDQHSLWPSSVPTPEGWTVALPATDRASCLAYVEEHWTDLRPRSLREHLAC